MKNLFTLTAISACAAFMSATVAFAQTPGTEYAKPTRQSVEAFMKTPVGKNFTAEEVMKAYQHPMNVAPMKAVKSDVLLSEDFNLLTKGTEDAPDNVEIDDATAEELMPGLIPWHVYQAGGKAYLGYENTDTGDPGYLMSKDLDLSKYQGVMRVSFRVKNANKDVTDQNLQYFVLNNDPSNMSIICASSLPMGTDWTECSFVSSGGTPYTGIMFFGWQGHVLVDSVVIEQLNYALATPTDISVSVAGGGQLAISWDAVDNATSYYVKAYRYSEYTFDITDEDLVGTATVDEAQCVISGYFDGNDKIYVEVVALNGEDESYPAYYTCEELSVDEVAAPVALEATDITENGFTANWEPSTFANNYKLTLIRTHEVTEETEALSYFDDGFDEIPYSIDNPNSTVMTTDGNPAYLDDMIAYPGWSVYLGVCATGFLGITNMYEPYGYPGALFGPVSDYSYNEGKATVSGMAISSVDDVVVKVGFGKLDQSTRTITFYGEPQEFTIKTSGSTFDVEINGGTEESQIIFQIVDASENGDIALFDNISISTTLHNGDVYTGLYSIVTLPYDVTSYNVEVPFPSTDMFEYSVVGKFGDVVSSESNVITVSGRNATSINGIIVEGESLSVYNMSGVKVLDNVSPETLNTLGRGVYVVRQGDKTFKVMR